MSGSRAQDILAVTILWREPCCALWDAYPIPGLCTCDASSTHPAVTTKSVSRHLHVSPKGQQCPGREPWVWEFGTLQNRSRSSASSCSPSGDMTPSPPNGPSPLCPPSLRQRPELITKIQTCPISCKHTANSAPIPVIDAIEGYIRFLVTT